MRYPPSFYKDLAAIREQYGDGEYHREDIRPDVEELFSKHKISGSDFIAAAANSVLDSVEKREDCHGLNGDLFNYEAHVALGDGKRIRRGRMTLGHAMRRKSVIDDNKIAQDTAWARETGWLNECVSALAGRAPTATVEDVIPQNEEMPEAAE